MRLRTQRRKSSSDESVLCEKSDSTLVDDVMKLKSRAMLAGDSARLGCEILTRRMRLGLFCRAKMRTADHSECEQARNGHCSGVRARNGHRGSSRDAETRPRHKRLTSST